MIRLKLGTCSGMSEKMLKELSKVGIITGRNICSFILYTNEAIWQIF